MMTLRKISTSLAFAACAAGAMTLNEAAVAQSEPAGDDQQLSALLKELKGEFDRGERDRLIDPWYLRDLRQILARYENPWDKRLFSDDFSGRGPQPDPPWQVTAGEFLIDWRHGLRSVVEPPAAAPAQQEEPKKSSDKDDVANLFGQILKQALDDKQTTGSEATQQPAAPQGPGFAAAIASVKVTNAFALRVELTSRAVPGLSGARFEFGPYQGAQASAGYRLAYNPGAAAGAPALELLRLSARGTISTIELTDQPLALEDGNPHAIEWTRDESGRMVVRVDGAEVMNVVDRGFRDPFDGIALVNSGGDYALRSLIVDGTS